MSRTACTEPQCLYNVALYLYLFMDLTVCPLLKNEDLLPGCTLIARLFNNFLYRIIILNFINIWGQAYSVILYRKIFKLKKWQNAQNFSHDYGWYGTVASFTNTIIRRTLKNIQRYF